MIPNGFGLPFERVIGARQVVKAVAVGALPTERVGPAEMPLASRSISVAFVRQDLRRGDPYRRQARYSDRPHHIRHYLQGKVAARRYSGYRRVPKGAAALEAANHVPLAAGRSRSELRTVNSSQTPRWPQQRSSAKITTKFGCPPITTSVERMSRALRWIQDRPSR